MGAKLKDWDKKDVEEDDDEEEDSSSFKDLNSDAD